VSDGADELRAELHDLAAQTLALVEWLGASGAEGLPTAARRAPQARRGEEQAGRPTAVSARPALGTTEAAPPARSAAAATAATPRAPVDRADALARLVSLEHEVRSCVRCPLSQHRTQTVFARGNPNARLVFVGEGPGAEEDAQGLPFVGAAGQLLDRMITAMGFGLDEVYICNVVKCRPPSNRKPEPQEMHACLPYLHEQLALTNPEVIVALGATAMVGLLDWVDAGASAPGISRLRGTWKLYQGRIPVMPTFHPAYLLRSPDKKREVWSDLQAVMRRMGREPPRPKQGG